MTPYLALSLALALSLSAQTSAHSTLGEPKPTTSNVCRLGGTSHGAFMSCPGPCALHPSNYEELNGTSPANPARIYGRGQRISVKYHRNNHGPGGFVRLSLVPLSEMMSKTAHARNAFHYSCWGAEAVPAKSNQRGTDRQGYSLVAADGKLHSLPVSYLETHPTIPTAVPDGDYILGWVWYGGLGGTIYQNTKAHPYMTGFFADYWACSYVRIQGGAQLAMSSRPVWAPDATKHWGAKCWSAADIPGVCTYEPCRPRSRPTVPREFANGRTPPILKRSNFASPVGRSSPLENAGKDTLDDEWAPTPVPDSVLLKEALVEIWRLKKKLQWKTDKTRNN